MKNKYKEHKIFIKWILSYMFILTIPIILSCYIYAESLNVIEEKTNSVYIESLKQFQTTIDTNLVGIEQIVTKMAFYSKINTLMVYNGQLGPIQSYNKLEIMNYIKNFKIANGYVDKLFIYFKNNDFIISDFGAYGPLEYYRLNYKEENNSYDRWYKKLKSNNYRVYYNDRIDNDNIEKNSIKQDELVEPLEYMQSLPIYSRKEVEANIVVELNKKAIYDLMIKNNEIIEGNIIILDKELNPVIATTNENFTKKLIENNFMHSENVSKFSIDGNRYIVNYVTSEVNGWKYIIVVPTESLLKKSAEIKNLIFITIALCFAIGGVAAYLFSIKNYNPISNLIRLFNKDEESLLGFKNEFDYIQKSVISVIKEKESIYEKLDQQKDMLRNNFISKLVRGKIDYSSVEQACDIYNIEFKGDFFSLITFYILDVNNKFFLYFKDLNKDDMLMMLKDIINRVILEIIKEEKIVFIVEINDMLTCIINFKEFTQYKDEKYWTSIMGKIKEEVETELGIFAIAAISECNMGIQAIPIAYQETIDTLEYNTFMEINTVEYCSEIKMNKEKKSKHDTYFQSEQQFINCIIIEDYKSAKNILMERTHSIIEDNSLSLEAMKFKIFGVANLLISAIEEKNSDFMITVMEEIYPFKRFYKCKTVYQLEKEMINSLEKFYDYYEEEKFNKQKSVIEDMKEFINKEYADINLNVSMVADNFDMNISRISKLFKQATGMGMLDYINRVRIDEAKKLLDHQCYSIKDISAMVGFYNSVNFIRVFKKYEGTTPGKKNKCEKNNEAKIDNSEKMDNFN